MMGVKSILCYIKPMDNVFAARGQMALSLGFHIVFAVVGMAMPWLMALAHYRLLTRNEERYLVLTKLWSKGVAVFFAVGAVSGTVLSFELGLLWPTFMKHAGPLIGMPFSLEGVAFFLEAIALGLFLYGWGKIPRWVHWGCGVLVGVAGIASAWFVVSANAWMNSPRGFVWVHQHAENVNPWASLCNPAVISEGIHMIIAAFLATSLAIAGLHALALLKGKNKELHQGAMRLALPVAAVAALLQVVSGDYSARDVAHRQPVKFAAMEALFHTEQPAAFVLGGIPNERTQSVRGGIYIPKLLGFLAHHDFQARVIGLDSVAKGERPPVVVTHVAFQLMIAIGTLLAGGALVVLFTRWLRPLWWWHRKFLRGVVLVMPLGFVALEAGWTVTEVGRQPWIIYGVLRTKDAVTPMPGLWGTFVLFAIIYLFLAGMVAWLLRRQFHDVA